MGRLSNKTSFFFLIVMMGFTLSLVSTQSIFAAESSKLSDDSDGKDWAAFGRTFGEQHYSPLKEINDETVGRLKLAWYEDLPAELAVSTPLAVNGVVYTSTGHSIIRAFDAKTGEQLWEYQSGAAEAAGIKLRNGWGSRGLAWWNDKIYIGTQDGRLMALDASNGKVLWSQMTIAKEDLRFISGAPRVFDGKVIIGHGGADAGDTRGYVTTYDAETGALLWRFYTVPGNPADGFENEAMEMAAKTWSGEWWKHGGGGTVWNAITYDEESDTVYLGTGNGAPWNHRVRSDGKGDNLFLCSVVAVDAQTGEYKWHYQINPGESWDYNAAMDMELADVEIEGKARKILITAPKNGFLYVIDRTNGKLISAEPIAKVSWAEKIDLETGRPVELPDIRYPDGKRSEMWPGTAGAHSWMPMSFNPNTNYVYIPKIEMPTIYDDRGIDTENWERPKGNTINGANNADMISPLPGSGTSALLAWDVRSQEKVWSVPTPGFWNGGTMTTAGNLVFQGHADGTFNAYSADKGKKLWSFDAQVGIIGAPISYEVEGKQYITLVTGFAGAGALLGEIAAKYGWEYHNQRRRVLTFTLDGDVSLPAYIDDSAKNSLDPNYTENEVLASLGEVVYGVRCTACHGVAGVAAGIAPDLRKSLIPRDAEVFYSIVKGGLLVPNGMPKYPELSEEDLDAIRQYVRRENQKALLKERAQ